MANIFVNFGSVFVFHEYRTQKEVAIILWRYISVVLNTFRHIRFAHEPSSAILSVPIESHVYSKSPIRIALLEGRSEYHDGTEPCAASCRECIGQITPRYGTLGISYYSVCPICRLAMLPLTLRKSNGRLLRIGWSQTRLSVTAQRESGIGAVPDLQGG